MALLLSPIAIWAGPALWRWLRLQVPDNILARVFALQSVISMSGSSLRNRWDSGGRKRAASYIAQSAKQIRLNPHCAKLNAVGLAMFVINGGLTPRGKSRPNPTLILRRGGSGWIGEIRDMKTTKPDARKTPFENFRDLTKRVIAIPHAEIQKRETEWKNGRKEHKSHHRHR